jgi:hypothetical protein
MIPSMSRTQGGEKDSLLSHVAVPLRRSPGFPPGLRYVTTSDERGHRWSVRGGSARKAFMDGDVCVPLRSVDTPVAKRPVDATAKDPPRSTRLASVPPWIVPRRFWLRFV